MATLEWSRSDPRPWLGRLANIAWGHWVLLVVLGFAILFPIGLVVVGGLQDPTTGALTLDNRRRFFGQPGLLDATRNTVLLTLVRQVIGLPIAIFFAWLIARTDLPFGRQFEFLFWIAFFLPALPVTLGWILLLDPSYGLANQALKAIGIGPFNIYSFWGIAWVHLVGGSIAVKVMLLTPLFRALDASLEEASRMSGAGVFGTLRRVVVPALAPGIIVVLMLSIIHNLQSFEVEVILGTPARLSVFSTQIYTLIHQPVPDFAAAMALSTAVLVILVPLILIQRRFVNRRQVATVGSRFRGGRLRLRGWRIPAFLLMLVVTTLMTVVPVAFLVAGSVMKLFGFFDIPDPWTTKHWEEVLGNTIFLKSLATTFAVGLTTAIAGLVLVTLVAYAIVRSRFRGRGGLDFVSWLPSIFPGIILGVGLLRFFLTFPPIQFLYGTVFVLAFALVIGGMTTGTQVIKSGLGQLGRDLEDAARIGGGGWLSVMRRVVIPLMTPTLMAVAALTFIGAARDVSSTVLLATGETRTLALLQLNYMYDGSYENGAVVGVIVVGLTTGVAILARFIGLRVAMRD
jgi:iron(III) transport system permease protein